MNIGKYPIIFFAVGTSITNEEINKLRKLMAKMTLTDAEKKELIELRTKAKKPIPLVQRYPFVIDAKKVKLVPISYDQQMSKDYTPVRNTESGQYMTKPVKNQTSLAFQTTNDEIGGFMLDSIFLLADLSFFDPDLSPRISYFGEGISIPDGYLTSVSMNREVSTNLVTLNLSIQREQQQAKNSTAGQPVEVEPSQFSYSAIPGFGA